MIVFLGLFYLGRYIGSFWYHVENDVVAYAWTQALEDSLMGFCVTAAAKTSNNQGLQLGYATHEAPRVKLVKVGHKTFPMIPRVFLMNVL